VISPSSRWTRRLSSTTEVDPVPRQHGEQYHVTLTRASRHMRKTLDVRSCCARRLGPFPRLPCVSNLKATPLPTWRYPRCSCNSRLTLAQRHGCLPKLRLPRGSDLIRRPSSTGLTIKPHGSASRLSALAPSSHTKTSIAVRLQPYTIHEPHSSTWVYARRLGQRRRELRDDSRPQSTANGHRGQSEHR
jgi:hypothetical protein